MIAAAKLDDAFVEKVRDAIVRTWNAIGADYLGSVFDAYGESPEVGNEEAIEATIDANRVRTYGGPEGREIDELIHATVLANGYAATLSFLASKISLY